MSKKRLLEPNFGFKFKKGFLSFVFIGAMSILNVHSKEVVFIDNSISDYQTITKELNKEYYLIDKSQNGLIQISNILKTEKNIDSIHIISHGDSGELFLGNSKINSTTLQNHQNELKIIQESLKENGDILLYGCNVASGQKGKEFINSWATLTSADIGASTNLTGNVNLGGDWMLEEKTGLITTAMLNIPDWINTLKWVNMKEISHDAIPQSVYAALDNGDISAYYSSVGSIDYQFDNANNMYISYVSGGYAAEWNYPTVSTTHVLKYNGSAWTELGTGQSIAESSLAVNKTTGDVYLGTRSSILHYNSSNNTWDTIGTNNDAYISGSVRDGLRFGADGTLYHAYINGINETNKRFILKKYNGTPNSWTDLTPSGGYADAIAYDVASDGTLYVLRMNNYIPSNSNWDTSIEKYSNGTWSNYYFNTSTSYAHGIYIPSSDDVYITEQAINTNWSVAKIESGNTRIDTGLSATNSVNHFFVGHDGELYAVKNSHLGGYRLYKYDGGTSWSEVTSTNEDYPTSIYSTTVDVGPDGTVYELGVPNAEDAYGYSIYAYNGIIEKLVIGANTAPTDINLSSVTVAENSTIGTTIGDFNTTDVDVNNTFTYSFCSGTDDANFTISGSTLQSNSVFDYETKSSYSICIRTKDDANASFDENMTINITNVNEAPIITSTPTTDVNESSPYSYILSGSDIEKNELNWSVKSGTSLPSWLNLSLGSTTVSTLAGSGTSGFADGNPVTAMFKIPEGVVADNNGNIYLADRNNARIRKIDSSGNVTTFAGSGTSGFADGSATTAKFYSPTGIAIDGSGNIYVADTNNHRIRKIDSSGNVTTLAGSGTDGFLNSTTSTNAQFSSPTGVAVDSNGNVYVADNGNHKIRKIDSSGNVTTFAGSSSGFADGSGTNAKFNSPQGVAIDGSGNVYVADTLNNRIRKIDSSSNVTTFAGSTQGFTDGNGANAKFYYPKGVVIDNSGNIFVTDAWNNKIRKIDRLCKCNNYSWKW